MRMSVCQLACWAAAALLLGSAPATADEVFVAHERGDGSSLIRGDVVEWTGEWLVVRHPSGRDERIAGRRVLEVRTQWSDACETAHADFAAGRYAAALSSYRNGYAGEKRPWAKRQLLVRMAWCFQYLGQVPTAGDAMLTVYASDPTTRDLDALPLSWVTVQPDAALASRAAQWLADSERPLARLLGASWLLAGPQRAAALRALQDLQTSGDARLAHLAQAQVWRTQLATATPDLLANWEEQIARMPKEVGGGPWYLLGQGYSARRQSENAALCYLRVPILYPQHRDLAGRSLLAAGEELKRMNRLDGSRELLREIIDRFGDTASAEQARRELAALASPDESRP